eukprot:COSAG06_NODE_65040_length_258_cov_0.597484_1_plen_78_part_01
MGAQADVAIAAIFVVGCVLFCIDGLLYVAECAAYAEEDRGTCASPPAPGALRRLLAIEAARRPGTDPAPLPQAPRTAR